MNGKIKRIVATILTLSILMSAELTNFLLIYSKVYASEINSIYLKNLTLSKSDINFHEDVFYYDVKVDKDTDEIKITAKPKDSDAAVSIDGDSVDENDNYKKTVSLEKGKNIIRVKVDNGNEYKTYTLNILRGEVEQDDIFLSNINLNVGNINFSKETTEYSINVKESVDKLIIGAIPEQDIYDVTIDGAKANKDKDYKQSEELEKGKNAILIKVKNKNNKERTYTLYINRENVLDSKTTQDNIYLNYIKVDNKTTINMEPNKTIYDLNLSELSSQVDLRAEPESTDYKVKINDKIIEEIDNYTHTITLKPGKNIVTISLQDEVNDKQRIYTLNINNGAVSNSSQVADSNSSSKCNQWIQENGKWKYIDALGNTLKDTWFHDKSTNKDYYLQDDGTMAVGWLFNNGAWYYLGDSGARQYGWLNNNGEWYYLNSNGIMLVGWIKDSNGKYYYLQSNGAMAKNKKVDMYYVGSDGAWIR